MLFNFNIDYEAVEASPSFNACGDTKAIHRAIGKNLAYVRSVKGIKQSAVIETIKTTKPTFIGWEKGRHALPIVQAAKLSVIYDIPLAFSLRDTPYSKAFGLSSKPHTLLADYIFLLIGGMPDDQFRLTIKYLSTLSNLSLEVDDRHSIDGYHKPQMIRWIEKHYTQIIADNISQFRRQHRISLDEFGSLIGVSAESVRNYESAATNNISGIVLARFTYSTKINPLVLIKGAAHHGYRLALDERLAMIRNICKESEQSQIFDAIYLFEKAENKQQLRRVFPEFFT